MNIGDIVKSKKTGNYTPCKKGTFGIILDNTNNYNYAICWFDDVKGISGVGLYYYGNVRVSILDDGDIEYHNKKDTNYITDEYIVLLCPHKDSLPNEILPLTVAKFCEYTGNNNTCTVCIDDKYYSVSSKYTIKYNEYIKYSDDDIKIPSDDDIKTSSKYNDDILTDIYNSLGE